MTPAMAGGFFTAGATREALWWEWWLGKRKSFQALGRTPAFCLPSWRHVHWSGWTTPSFPECPQSADSGGRDVQNVSVRANPLAFCEDPAVSHCPVWLGETPGSPVRNLPSFQLFVFLSCPSFLILSFRFEWGLLCFCPGRPLALILFTKSVSALGNWHCPFHHTFSCV